MWRNGRRKGLKIPRGGPVPVRVRSQAPTLQARLEAIRKREFGTSATPFFSARPPPSLSAPFMSPENEIVTRLRLDTLVSRRPLSAIAMPSLHCVPLLTSPVTSTTDGSLALLAKRNTLSESRAFFHYRQSLCRTLTRLVAFATSRTLSAFAIPSFGNELPLSLRFTFHFVRELYSLLTVAACGILHCAFDIEAR